MTGVVNYDMSGTATFGSPRCYTLRMSEQFFDVGTELGTDGKWYAVMKYPKEEGGSIERAGPFETYEEAEGKMQEALTLIKKMMGNRIAKIEKIEDIVH